MAEVDVNLIEQVLINFLVNTLEALKEKALPRIVLSAALENNRVLIKVADNGSGISEELMDKIFIPFFSTQKKRQWYRTKFMQTDHAIAQRQYTGTGYYK